MLASMKNLDSPLMYYGGKKYMVKELLRLMPKHKIYVEAFAGSAKLLFAKEPSEIEVYNDIDSALYDFFMVLANKEEFNRFIEIVKWLPYSRKLWNECKNTWFMYEDRVERVWRWFVLVRQSFDGLGGHWSYGLKKNKAIPWVNVLERLPLIHKRLQRVIIENLDWRDIFKKYDTEDTLFYLDPPYISDTRAKQHRKVYKYEMSIEDHKELVEKVLKLKGKVMISGYKHPVYEPLVENGFALFEFKKALRSFNPRILKNPEKKNERIECIWVKPNPMNKTFSFIDL